MIEWLTSHLLWIVVIAGTIGAAEVVRQFYATSRAGEQAQQAKLQEAKDAASKEPEKARLAWDLAVVQMDGYFRRNLDQIRAIFAFAVVVMAVGFGIVAWGILISFRNPDHLTPAVVASASGVITQFIGATFMAIYRSTLQQAGGFMSILERINAVGMAVQILDGIPESELAAKTAVRSEMAKILIAAVREHPGLQCSPEQGTELAHKTKTQ